MPAGTMNNQGRNQARHENADFMTIRMRGAKAQLHRSRRTPVEVLPALEGKGVAIIQVQIPGGLVVGIQGYHKSHGVIQLCSQ
eukprot:1147123-Pelagomonas_calceolata.AAC.1